MKRQIWRMIELPVLRNKKKIDTITNSCSKPYFGKILNKLFDQSAENANIICDYLIAEETEINIKNFTKE